MKNIVNLGNVATYINGYAFKPSDWAEDGTPIIRIQDLTGNSYQMNRFKGIVDSKYDVNSGDVLISWSASLGVYVWNRGNAVLNQHIFKVVFDKEEVDKDFFVFQIDNLLKRAANQAHGATMRHLTKPVFDALPFYLPDIKTQRLISSKLNLIVHLIEDHHEQLKKLDELIRSRFIEMFGDLINEPKYPGIKLGSLGVMITGGTPSRKHDEYYGGNIPFISTPCLGSNFISEKNVQNYLTEAGVKNSATHKIPPYSLMVGNRVGVGKSSINTCEMCTNQDILSFVHIDTNRFDLLFLKKVIDQYSPYFDEHKRGATIQGVPSKVIKDSMVPDVPLEMQKRYTALVKQSDKSKMAVQKSLDELETLKKSLMQTYFG